MKPTFIHSKYVYRVDRETSSQGFGLEALGAPDVVDHTEIPVVDHTSEIHQDAHMECVTLFSLDGPIVVEHTGVAMEEARDMGPFTVVDHTKSAEHPMVDHHDSPSSSKRLCVVDHEAFKGGYVNQVINNKKLTAFLLCFLLFPMFQSWVNI